MNRRVLIGFALAPLLPCLLAAIFIALRSGNPAAIASGTLRFAAVAYPFAWLLGALLGALAGVFLPMVLGAESARPLFSGLYPPAVEYALFGGITAWAFWWIVRRAGAKPR